VTTTEQVRAAPAAPHRFVIDVPGLRLVSLTNGAQFARFQTAAIKKRQCEALELHVKRRSVTCPFDPHVTPLRVTITRRSPSEMDDDNATASAKYVRDWLAKWIGVNDRHRHLVEYVVEQEKTKRGKSVDPASVYGVRIEIAQRRDG